MKINDKKKKVDTNIKLLLLFLSTTMSVLILINLIQTRFITLAVVITIGCILTMFIEQLAKKEFKESFGLIQKLDKYSHPLVHKIWELGKTIAIVLILKFVGVDLLQITLDLQGKGTNVSVVLWDSTLFVLGVAAIATVASAFYRLEFDKIDRFVKIDKPINLEIELPNGFIQDITEEGLLAVYKNHLTDEIFFIAGRDKSEQYTEKSWMDILNFIINYIESKSKYKVKSEINENEKIAILEYGSKLKTVKEIWRIIETDAMIVTITFGASKKTFERSLVRYREALDGAVVAKNA